MGLPRRRYNWRSLLSRRVTSIINNVLALLPARMLAGLYWLASLHRLLPIRELLDHPQHRGASSGGSN